MHQITHLTKKFQHKLGVQTLRVELVELVDKWKALRSKNIMNQLRNWYYQDLEAQRNRFRSSPKSAVAQMLRE